MALQPNKVKYRKMHRGSRKGTAQRGNKVSFGSYGLQALDRGWITGTQIEAARVAISRGMKRKGSMWIRVFPQKSVTKKPLEVRMGKGKANVDHWVAVVKPATMLFEVEGVSETVAREALSSAAAKMPIRCRLALRE
jgi:large subunit ribosomal protein L16|tara:strand:- start:706 stop:1116 length:411 start_codon:yes stop_codon:yes gene_type:complete